MQKFNRPHSCGRNIVSWYRTIFQPAIWATAVHHPISTWQLHGFFTTEIIPVEIGLEKAGTTLFHRLANHRI